MNIETADTAKKLIDELNYVKSQLERINKFFEPATYGYSLERKSPMQDDHLTGRSEITIHTTLYGDFWFNPPIELAKTVAEQSRDYYTKRLEILTNQLAAL